MVRRLYEDVLPLVEKCFAHDLGKNRKRKLAVIRRKPFAFSFFRKIKVLFFPFFSQKILAPVVDKDAASLHGPGVSLLGQKIEGMFDRNDADTGILGDDPLGGKLRAVGIDSDRKSVV